MPIHNDPALLGRMMSDMAAADPLFKPTSFWQHHESSTVDWLTRRDLNYFRDGQRGLGAAFGALHFATPPWRPEVMKRMEAQAGSAPVRAMSRVMALLGLSQGSIANPATGALALRRLRKCSETLQALSHYTAALLDVDGTLQRIDDSGLGSPSDAFTVDGRLYTYGLLKRFSQYAYVKKFMNFDALQSVLEIGSGYGGQAELLLKAHPHLKMCIVDIPPQLYVAQQYLSACFPGEVVGYADADRPGRLDDLFARGRIVCLPTWRLPDVPDRTFDLFWNSASFQEMEPAVVRNYASHVQRVVKSWVYLMNKPGGTRLEAGSGRHGVQEQTKREHYQEAFSDFSLVDLSEAQLIPRIQAGDVYAHMLFSRRDAAVPAPARP